MTKARFRIHQAKSALAELLPAGLSPSQIAVAQLGPAAIGLVYGAPGSGKTLAIQARVSELVGRGIAPDRILVFSATRESATALRDLLALDLQAATAGPLARTINSFAFSILTQSSMAQGLPAPALISGAEQDQLIKQILDSADLSASWPAHISELAKNLSGFRAELRDLIAVCIEHQLAPDQLELLAKKHSKPEWLPAAEVLARYQAQLAAPEFNGRFDSSSLLNSAMALLAEAESAQAIDQIIIDDAQELTPAASKFIAELARVSGAGMVLVGDPDSVTLSFRAADPTGMRQLAEGLAKQRGIAVSQIDLAPTHAVRSPALGSLMARITRQLSVAQAGRQRKGVNPSQQVQNQVESQSPAQSAVEAKIFAQSLDETFWLSKRLRETHLIDKIPYSQMAVVVRSRAQLALWSGQLAHLGVPVSSAHDLVAPREQFAACALLEAAKFVVEQARERTVVSLDQALELLTSPLCGLDAISIRRLRRTLRRQELTAGGLRNSDELLIELFSAPGAAVTVPTAEGRAAARFVQSLTEARELLAESNPKRASIEDLLWLLWSNSKLAEKWQTLARGTSEVSLQANRNLDSVVELFAAANRYAERYPDHDPAVFVEQQLAISVAEDTLSIRPQAQNSVAVLTPAGLIGRRFSVVALPSLIEGAWPNLRARSSLLGAKPLDELLSGRVDEPKLQLRSELPDEIRMLHKAVGAASQKMFISATQAEDQQVSQFVTLMLSTVPEVSREPAQQFDLRSITAMERRNLTSALRQQDKLQASQSALNLTRLSAAGAPGAHPSNWYGLPDISSTEPLADLAGDESVVISPSRLESFLKCPLHWFLDSHGAAEGNFSANLGTLMHSAVELLIDAESIDEQAIWSTVESQWHTLSFEAEWLEESARRRAKQMIANTVQYLNDFAQSGGRVLATELGFSFQQGQAQIKGKIDRVELLPDGRVVVIDLKTGQKQFSAQDAIHHSQLGLYQLAFEAGALDQRISESIGDGLKNQLTSGGAKLVLVGQSKLTQRDQPPLNTGELRQEFLQQIEQATQGMSGNAFVAQISEHCTNQNEYGSCQIHLVRPVSYVG